MLEFDLSADREGRLCAKNARVLERPTTDCAPLGEQPNVRSWSEPDTPGWRA